jgi:2-C-methyl-D-erythritol 2,4-cyclodiphosphate synthase
MVKIGLGYDLHRLVYGKPLVLGGVNIESSFGSEAHSDGDAFIHALVDSILSPLGAPDIGVLFPDSDEAAKGMNSLDILKKIKDKYLAGSTIINIDGVVILDNPKIAAHIPEIKKILSEALGIPAGRIGIKGKTSEHTRPFTVECHVVTLLDTSI